MEMWQQQKDTETSESNDNSKKYKVAVAKQTKVKSSNSKKLIPVKLIETVDGDTIKVNYKDKEETVRYLLIDTPESKNQNLVFTLRPMVLSWCMWGEMHML